MTEKKDSPLAPSPGPAVPDYVRLIAPYVPGKPVEELEREIPLLGTTKLASNENPLGPSPLAVEAARVALAGVNRYPDGSGFYLREAVASLHHVDRDQVILGNGSTDLIEICVRTFIADGDAAVFGENAFLMFRLAVEGVNGRSIAVTMPNYRHDLAAMAHQAASENAKIVYLANPNNPTGTYVSREELDRYFDRIPPSVLTIMDEAYFEYVRAPDYPDAMDDFRLDRNVLVLRTFSKIYGLAGLRIGYGIAAARVLGEMNKIRSPFNTGSVSQIAAIAALGDEKHRVSSRDGNAQQMGFVREEFERRGITSVPSVANFVLVLTAGPASTYYEELLKRGVIVRPMAAYGLPNAFRLSIGSRLENDRFFLAWDDFAKQAGV